MGKFGLALGGGGARGAAHVGVLMELEKMGIWPDLITGTSMGALLGGLVAYGLKVDDIYEALGQVNFSRVYGLPEDGRSLSANAKLEELIVSIIGRPTFDELEIPLAVVATDLESRQEVILGEGDVVTALLASAAFPVLLPPVEIEGRVLVDGGLVNNVPFDVIRARGATSVVAVALNNSTPYGVMDEEFMAGASANFLQRVLTRGKRQPLWQLVTAVSDIITTRNMITRQAVSQPDLLLRPFIGDIGLFDFNALDIGIEAGRRATRDAEAELKKLYQRAHPE
jgi:NTE family protein